MEDTLGQKNILMYKKLLFRVLSSGKWRILRTDLNLGQKFKFKFFLSFIFLNFCPKFKSVLGSPNSHN